jgi:hypothetical protein
MVLFSEIGFLEGSLELFDRHLRCWQKRSCKLPSIDLRFLTRRVFILIQRLKRTNVAEMLWLILQALAFSAVPERLEQFGGFNSESVSKIEDRGSIYPKIYDDPSNGRSCSL